MDVSILVGACAGLAIALVIVAVRMKKQASEVQTLSKKVKAMQQAEEEVRELTGKLEAAQAIGAKAASLAKELERVRKESADVQVRLAELEADQGDKQEIERLTGELAAARKEAADAKDRVAELEADQDDKEEIIRLTQELEQVRQEIVEKSAALESLENKFDESVDEVVQSTIDKINHAEQAKEEAIKAAEDNYEMVVQAHAQLAEKDKLIKQLQGG